MRKEFGMDLDNSLACKLKQERLSKEECGLLIQTNVHLITQVQERDSTIKQHQTDLATVGSYLAKITSIIQSHLRNTAVMIKTTQDSKEIEYLQSLTDLSENSILVSEDIAFQIANKKPVCINEKQVMWKYKGDKSDTTVFKELIKLRYKTQELSRLNNEISSQSNYVDKKLKLDKDIRIEQLKNEATCKDHLINDLMHKAKTSKELVSALTSETQELRAKLVQIRSEYTSISLNMVKNNQYQSKSVLSELDELQQYKVRSERQMDTMREEYKHKIQKLTAEIRSLEQEHAHHSKESQFINKNNLKIMNEYKSSELEKSEYKNELERLTEQNNNLKEQIKSLNEASADYKSFYMSYQSNNKEEQMEFLQNELKAKKNRVGILEAELYNMKNRMKQVECIKDNTDNCDIITDNVSAPTKSQNQNNPSSTHGKPSLLDKDDTFDSNTFVKRKNKSNSLPQANSVYSAELFYQCLEKLLNGVESSTEGLNSDQLELFTKVNSRLKYLYSFKNQLIEYLSKVKEVFSDIDFDYKAVSKLFEIVFNENLSEEDQNSHLTEVEQNHTKIQKNSERVRKEISLAQTYIDKLGGESEMDDQPMLITKLNTLQKENMVLKNNLNNFKDLMRNSGPSGSASKKIEMEVEQDLVSMVQCAFGFLEKNLVEIAK